MTRAMNFLGGWLLAATLLGLTAAAGASQPGAEHADYKGEHGPHPVAVVLGVWRDASRDGRAVSWKLYLPRSAAEPLPVVVWSHGLGGSRNGAEYLGRHLASHGYATFHIQHPGSDAVALRRGRAALLEAIQDPQVSLQRFLDVPFAVAQIGEMTRAGKHAGRFDLDRMGMSGHSYGAITTLIAAGQAMGPQQLQLAVPAFKGAFAMSPAPPRNAPAQQAFSQMLMPLFHLTGTDDASPIDDLEPIDRRVPFDTIDSVDQYLLILDQGVHMTFSGRREPAYPARDRHHTLIRMAAVAFWDALLKDDAAARAWLENGGMAAALDMGGTFEFKPGERANTP